MRSRELIVGVACGAVLGAGVIAAVDAGTETAGAQGGFEVTPAQLKINQNISSAAVRRGNRALNYLAPIRTTTTDNADTGSNGVRPLSQIPGSGDGWTSSTIGDAAITRSKVANEAIDSQKIAPGGVTSGDLADNSVTNAKIGAAAVSSAKIASGAVETANIANAAVTTEKLANEGVTTGKLAPDVTGKFPKWITKTTNNADAVGRMSDPSYSVVRIAAGNYRADFGDTNISQCSWSGTPSVDAGLPAAVSVRVALDGTDNTRVFLNTIDGAGTPVESGWSVQAYC
jgi:hypothetical protein